jgi:exosortase/archaeosortase family protein
MAVPPEEGRTRRLVTPVRGFLALVIWTLMIGGIAYAAAGRTVEARIAAVLAGPVMAGRSRSMGDILLTGLGTRKPLGLHITNECTVFLLIVPMLFIAGLIILFHRFRIHSVLFGLVLGLIVVTVTNQIRVIGIAWATEHYGVGLGYELSHKFVGSVLAILGFSLGVLVMLKFAPGKRSGKRA